jgi:uracil-DNA glycosylase family 4
MTAPSELLRRYLRQRAELGETELILDRLVPDELHALLSAPPEAAALPAPERPSARADGALAPTVSTPAALAQLGSLGELRERVVGCRACSLCESRSQVVFGEGNPDAELLVVGEAPGAEEDRTGRPFVGRAGKLLDLLLMSVGFGREDVFICNVLKCRPPGNRNPQAEEVASCSPFLRRQVELVRPRAVMAFGTFAAQTLLETDVPIGRLRGGVHDYHGVPLIPTYHPAALLRNPGWLRPVWEDLQRLRALIDAV